MFVERVVTGFLVVFLAGALTACGQKSPRKKHPKYDKSFFDPSPTEDQSSSEGEGVEEILDDIAKAKEEVLEFLKTIAVPSAQCYYTNSVVSQAVGIHYLYGGKPGPMDASLSNRAFDHFLWNLDPHGIYFDAMDRLELKEEYGGHLGVLLKKNDCSFLDNVLKLYRTRWESTHDALQHQLVVAGDLNSLSSEYSGSKYFSQYLKPLFYIRDELGFEGVKELISHSWSNEHSLLKNRFSADNSAFGYEIFLKSFLSSLDPSTNYFPHEEGLGETTDFGWYFAYGKGFLEIEALTSTGLAKLAGLKVGDRVVAMECFTELGPCKDRLQITLAEETPKRFLAAVSSANNRVVLTIQRPVSKHQFAEFQKTIPLSQKSSQASGYVDELDGTQIGVIKVPEFYQYHDNQSLKMHSTYDDVRKILEGFVHDDVDGVVVDLRGNKGGAFKEGVHFLSLFLSSEEAFQVALSSDYIKENLYSISTTSEKHPHISDHPLVILVDKKSSSISELIAQTIQVHGRGIVVGDTRTSGKATMQNRFRNVGAKGGSRVVFKVTTGQFFSAAGESIQEVGVKSDVVLPSLMEVLAKPHSHLRYAIKSGFSIPAVKGFESQQSGLAMIVSQLQENSAERVKSSTGFALIKLLAQRIRQVDSGKLTKDMSDLTKVLIKQKLYHYSDAKTAERIQLLYPSLKADYALHEASFIAKDFVQLLKTQAGS